MNIVFIYNRSLLYTHPVSFHIIPTPLTRNYCTEPFSLSRLSADIYFIYKDMIDNVEYNMSPHQVDVIRQKIETDTYILSPLLIEFFKLMYIHDFLTYTLPNYPDLMIVPSEDSEINAFCLMPYNKEDVLVYMGLSKMLFELTHAHMSQKNYRFCSLLDPFYDSLVQMGMIDKLYRIYLLPSLNVIPNERILAIVKPIIMNESVYKLIKSFLELPVYDEVGGYQCIFGGIKPVGDLSRVLFEIVLKETFDREINKRFPGVTFARYLNNVFVPARWNYDKIFDENAGYELLKDMGL